MLSLRQKRSDRLKEYGQITLIIGAGLVFGVIFQLLPLGQLAVILYGLIALLKKVPSRVTLIVALIILTLAGLMAVFGYRGFIAQNFAIYSYILLVVGVVSAALEQWRDRSHRN